MKVLLVHCVGLLVGKEQITRNYHVMGASLRDYVEIPINKLR